MAIIFCQVVACTSPQSNISPTSETDAYREDTLGGERVLIPTGISKEVFYPTIVKQGDPNARAAARKLSLSELAEITRPILAKYPDLSSNPLKTGHLKRILHDFPDFKNEQTVREKADVILQYYNGLIKSELKLAIEEALKRKGSGRVANGSFGNINSLEWQHLNNNPIMIPAYQWASQRALAETSARFGTVDEGLRGNAFQHAVWNCLIIREAMYRSYSKNNAILFTRNITSDHECNDDGSRKYGNNEAMDLHNNLSARSWFGNNSSGSVWPFSINCPSEADIYSAWYHAATNRNFHICNPATTITAMFSWDFLYGEARADMGDKLYFFMPILPGC